MRIFAYNPKTKKKFEVLRKEQDGEKIKLWLKGIDGEEFDETYDKERFIKLGYQLVKEDAIPQDA